MKNFVQITGRMGGEPEIKYTPNGKAVCKFSVAYNEKRKSKDGSAEERAHFFDCECWDFSAEAMRNFKKGDAITVTGSLIQERWEKEGRTFSRIRIRADGLSKPQFAPRPAQQSATPSTTAAETASPIDNDDVPF